MTNTERSRVTAVDVVVIVSLVLSLSHTHTHNTFSSFHVSVICFVCLGCFRSDENEELGKPIRDDTPEDPDEERVVQGVVTNDKMDRDSDGDGPTEHSEANENKQQKPVSWRINIMLAMVSCWLAMALTGWGSVSNGGNAANPSVGRVSMWMIIASQWVMFLLYGWTLVAPQLFPNRDFS